MKKHLIGLLLILSVLGVHSVMADYVNNGGGTPLLSWYKVSLDSFLIDVRSKDGNPVGGVSIYTQYSAPAQYWDRRYTSFFTWYYTTSYATYVYDYENYTTNACGSVETKPIKVKANLSEKPEFYIWAKPVIEKDFTVEFPTGEKMNYRCATMSVIDNDGHLDQVNGRAGNIVPGRKVAHTECDNWGKDFVRGSTAITKYSQQRHHVCTFDLNSRELEDAVASDLALCKKWVQDYYSDLKLIPRNAETYSKETIDIRPVTYDHNLCAEAGGGEPQYGCY